MGTEETVADVATGSDETAVDPVKDLLERRMKRTAAAILGVKDALNLPRADGDWLRETVLRELNHFRELCFDIIDSLGDHSMVVNGAWLEKLDAIHDAVVPTTLPPSTPVAGREPAQAGAYGRAAS